MDEPLEEAPVGPLRNENTAHINNNKDNHNTQDEGETDDQSAQSVSGPTPHKVFEQSGIDSSEQTNDKASSQVDRTSQEVDRRSSGQAERRTSEQVDRRSSGQAERRTSQQPDRRSSVQAERRTSQQPDRRSSVQAERRTSQQADHRSSVQAERRISESTGQQLPSLPVRKVSEQLDDRASVPSDEKATEVTGLSDQGTAEQTDTSEKTDQVWLEQEHRTVKSQGQADYEADIVTQQFGVNEDGEEEEYFHVKISTEKETEYRSYYKTIAQTEDRVLSEFTGREANKIQPCTFEDSQTDIKSRPSSLVETESATTVQAYNPTETVLANDPHSSYEKLPSITTKVYYTASQEKIQVTETTTNNLLESEQRKNSQKQSQFYKRKFPPIVYEDPYQVSLRYMEKHNILQIFQITENLVYEKPEDPLIFMLTQVQEMIRTRDQKWNI